MQLKLKRTQRDTGIVSKSVVFCLDARVSFTRAEADSIRRYKLANQVIYNSEASKQLLAKGDGHSDGSMSGGLKALATYALAAMKLNISVASLEQGQHIECKSMEELLAAEDAVIEACKNLRSFLDTAATFDGRETVVEFPAGAAAQIVAKAAPPEPVLVERAPSIPAAAPAADPPPIVHRVADTGPDNWSGQRRPSSGGEGTLDYAKEQLRSPIVWVSVAIGIILTIMLVMSLKQG